MKHYDFRGTTPLITLAALLAAAVVGFVILLYTQSRVANREAAGLKQQLSVVESKKTDLEKNLSDAASQANSTENELTVAKKKAAEALQAKIEAEEAVARQESAFKPLVYARDGGWLEAKYLESEWQRPEGFLLSPDGVHLFFVKFEGKEGMALKAYNLKTGQSRSFALAAAESLTAALSSGTCSPVTRVVYDAKAGKVNYDVFVRPAESVGNCSPTSTPRQKVETRSVELKTVQ